MFVIFVATIFRKMVAVVDTAVSKNAAFFVQESTAGATVALLG